MILSGPMESQAPVAPRLQVKLPIEIRFAETDAMGVVHHSNYIIWFEAARIAWLEAAGSSYAAIARDGNHFAVTALHVDYRRTCRFGESIYVAVALTLLRSRQLAFDYEVRRRDDDALLASARSEHVCVDLEGRVARIPETVLERLQQVGLRS